MSDPDLQDLQLHIRLVRDSYQIDKHSLLKAVNRSVGSYNQHAFVFDEVAARLIERLDLLSLTPQRILDLGTGTGRHLKVLREHYPKATIVGADISTFALHAADVSSRASWWQRHWRQQPTLVCMDAGAKWPFADGAFDLVLSNMMLPWISDYDQLAHELERVLSSDGTFFISSAGPDTLQELRQAWASVDDSVHINAFLDMHDLGDMLVRAGLADPVMDNERIQVRYADVETLLAEMEATGCHCVLQGRRRGLMTRQARQQVVANYPGRQSLNVDLSVDSSSICATLEVVVAHGWKRAPSTGRKSDTGEHTVHFQPKTWQSDS